MAQLAEETCDLPDFAFIKTNHGGKESGGIFRPQPGHRHDVVRRTGKDDRGGKSPAVFAHRSEYEGGAIVTAHNFAAEATEVKLAVAGSGVGLRAVDLLRDESTDLAADGTLSLQLEPHAARWLRIVGPQDRYLI